MILDLGFFVTHFEYSRCQLTKGNNSPSNSLGRLYMEDDGSRARD